MIGRVVIEFNLDSSQLTQLQRTGFSVYKRGSKLRLEVGGNLIAQDKGIVRIEELHHERSSSESGSPPE